MAEKLRLSLCKTFEFSAAHRLFRPEWSEEQNAKTFGMCANPTGHGHNYRLEVFVSGEVDPVSGMVIDASTLQQLVDEVLLGELDHKNLDVDVHWLKGKISSVENIIAAMWGRLEPAVRSVSKSGRLERLVLWETGRIFATLEREG